MRFFSFLPRRRLNPPPSVSDQFLVANVGTTILLKACGFIEEQGAELLDIGEDHLRLRVGPAWWSRYVPVGVTHPPVEVTISFRAADDHPGPSANRFRAQICVTMQPISRFVREAEFQDIARKLMWQLRSYFIAS